MLSPNKDSIMIGDTIWVNSVIPFRLQPTQNGLPVGDSIDYSGASNMQTDFHITSPQGIGIQADALDSFLVIPVIGNIQPNYLDIHAAKTVQFTEVNNNFELSFYLIARKKGVYVFFLVDIFKAVKQCSDGSIEIKMNEQDNHLHYIKDIYYGGGPVDPSDSTHAYCFKVY